MLDASYEVLNPYVFVRSVNLDEVYVVVTADHTTSSITREHEGNPIPIAIADPYVRTDDVDKYDGRAWLKGA